MPNEEATVEQQRDNATEVYKFEKGKKLAVSWADAAEEEESGAGNIDSLEAVESKELEEMEIDGGQYLRNWLSGAQSRRGTNRRGTNIVRVKVTKVRYECRGGRLRT